jgi:hypothetical protein
MPCPTCGGALFEANETSRPCTSCGRFYSVVDDALVDRTEYLLESMRVNLVVFGQCTQDLCDVIPDEVLLQLNARTAKQASDETPEEREAMHVLIDAMRILQE